MKTLIRAAVSRIPGLRFWVARAQFLGPRRHTHRFWGVFPTYAAARRHVPVKYNHGFAAPNLDDFEEVIPERDQEAIRILAGLVPEAKHLFDLGGNVGTCFYAYRKDMAYPHDFRWTVCDLPPVNAKGRALAQKRNETQLAFTEDRSAAEGAGIYLANGSLQYLEEPLGDILAKLKTKPPHVIVNRVTLTEDRSFFTLQNLGYAVMPYHIENLKAFADGVTTLGYRLADHWGYEQACEVLLRPDLRPPQVHGFYFVRNAS
ncbi:MAG TPA: methyltransferase, TIGR04325 family [Candidatus Methylacidiphilales bacterium]|jgi:putative methyltransferase (TIGR04325 family)|nr:methyltransferase, TIGR04325 family [Candidatus Methylacidiphilales bacterium]